jgi:hypothetical protein
MAVPQDVMVEAQKATQALIDQVVRGNQDAAFKNMNPAWKKILARKNGGEKKLMQEMRKQFAALQAQGVSIRAMEAQRPKVAYEVDFGVIDGVGIYKQWMVFVPTVSLVTAVNRKVSPPDMYDLRADGFQVALCTKGKNDWSLIDGADLKAANLRELFPFLPKDDQKLGFPSTKKQVLRVRSSNSRKIEQDHSGR